MNIFELDRSYIANTYARFPINIVKGKGSLVWDCDGKEYIDSVNNYIANSISKY